jgi:hypothetical protein
VVFGGRGWMRVKIEDRVKPIQRVKWFTRACERKRP